MALGTVDAILDSFIQRGIGTSGLAARRTQQEAIEDNKSLRANVLESQVTQENQKRNINSEFVQKMLSSRTGGTLRSGGRGDAGFDPSKPTAFVNIFGDRDKPAASYSNNGQSPIRDSKGRAFRVTFAGGGNLKEEKDFASLGELMDFIKNDRFTGHQIRLAGTPSMIDENESRMLQEAGINPIATELAKRIVSSWPKMGYDLRAFRGGGRGYADKPEVPVLLPQQVVERGPAPASKARKAFDSASSILTQLGKGVRKY